MKYTDEIIYSNFDFKLFIIILLSFLVINLVLIILNNKYKIFKFKKVLFAILIFLTIISFGLGYYFSFSSQKIIPNKYYDNQFDAIYANEYIQAMIFKNIGYEYASDETSRNVIEIERNLDNEEFILKYTIDGKTEEYLFTNSAPLIKENQLYKGFQTLYPMKNYGRTLNIDMTFDTNKKEENKVLLEVYSINGEKLTQGGITIYKKSIGYN